MQLTAEQRKQLHKALLEAFPTKQELAKVLSFHFDNTDLDAIAGDGTRSDVVFKLIKWAEARWIINKLVKAALAENSDNLLLNTFSKQLNLSQQSRVVEDTTIQPLKASTSNTKNKNTTVSQKAPEIITSSHSQSSNPTTIQKVDTDRIEHILAKYVTAQPTMPQMVFNYLLSRSGLPESWLQNLKGTWTGAIPIDAHNLIKWAKGKGLNPNDQRFTSLACILNELLPNLGFEERIAIVAIIVRYELYLDQSALDALIIQYQVPLLAYSTQSTSNIGPNIDWEGSPESLQLQARKQTAADYLDVGDLMRAIQKSVSVCRIEYPNMSVTGTGFLVASNLLMTNYHVLQPYKDSNITTLAQNAILKFGCYTSAIDTTSNSNSQKFRTVGEQSILSASPPDELDYVLLQVEDRIQSAESIGPVSWNLSQKPTEHMDLNILQHPEGGPMKLALSKNGVEKILMERGLLQYSTNAAGGSSGAPCFDKSWNLVGIHHAERSRTFDSIREGILFSSIYDRIQRFLP